MMKWPVAVLCLALAFGLAAADLGATPPSTGDVSLLTETVLSDPNFFLTPNQTWDEESDQLCVFDKKGFGGRGLCMTNIGWYVKASGLSQKIIEDPAMQFYLRFQMREACHGSTVPVEASGGRECAEWGEDWSRYPLVPVPHKFNVSSFCRTVLDANEQPIGCANNYLANECCSVETDAEWNRWYDCEALPDEVPEGSRDQTKNECRQLLFMEQTGWNYTVLFRMADLILQNGNDCQKWYEQKYIGTDPLDWETYCTAGDVPAPAVHPILTELAKPPPDGKLFFGTTEEPLDPKAVFNPPPPYSPPPPPAPPGTLVRPPATGPIGNRPAGENVVGTGASCSVTATIFVAVASLFALVVL